MATRAALCGAMLILAGVLGAHSAVAADGFAPPAATTDSADFDRDVFFFAGRFESHWFPDGLFPAEALWTPDFFENNFIVGGGYQQFFGQWNGWKLGLEAGLAARLGDTQSLEAWTGGVIRSPGFDVGPVHVTPAVTGGFSAVTGTIGVETERADKIHRGVPLLFYMGPEIDFSVASNPNMEVFWRLQHRSGGYGIIAPIDGSNADTVGVRFKF